MEKIIAAIFFLATITLLIGARFGLVWAGGSGYVAPLSAVIEVADGNIEIERVDQSRDTEAGEKISRGEKILVGDGSRTLVRVGQGIIIALDQRTVVVLEKLTPQEVEIKILRGRILAETSNETERLTISTPRSKSVIKNGAITAVRYDFLDKTSVAPLKKTTVEITLENLFVKSTEPQEILELEPFNILPTSFNLEVPDVVGFYQWAL